MRYAALVMLALIALGPARAPAAVFNPETFTLPNGMDVIVVPNRRAPIVTHMVYYRVGAAEEAMGKSGIAHFLEHLMFKATKNLAAGEFSRTVARNGGRDNAFTSWDYTGYVQTVARDRLEIVMRMEADRMAGLALTDATVDPERDVILEERRQVIDNVPARRLSEQVHAALFLNHPYGRPIIGWEHEIRGLTRADAEAWHRAWYAPNNAILVVAGDVDAAELRPLAEKYYGAVAARDVPARVRPAEPPPQAARRVTLRDERVRQPNWSRTYLAPGLLAGDSKHAYPLQVLVDLLGGQSGRLYRALVVDLKIAVSAGASYDSDVVDLATFGLYASPTPGGDVEALERAIDEELAKLLRDGVTADEVERAKTRLAASAVFARDSLGTAPRVIGSAVAAGIPLAEVEAWPERIAVVTQEQVNEAARAVLRDERGVTGLLLPRAAP